MQAGAASVDITPPLGTHLAGDGCGAHRPVRKVLDPLYARALVLEAGEKRACILAMDLLAVTLEYTRQIREEAARRFALCPEAVLVHVQQNHSAPSLGPLMLDPDFPLDLPEDQEYVAGAESGYCRFAIEKAMEAIQRAFANLRPVQVAWGRGVCEGLAFNRRGICGDGTVCMPWFYSDEKLPLGPTHIRRIEGPFDPEVSVIALRDDGGRMVSLLGNFACHPVNVFATDKLAVSGDWPGAWASAMAADHPGCVPLVLNGCCGNLNPWPAFIPDFHPDHRRMGQRLGGISHRIVERMTFGPCDRLDWRNRRVDLDYRQVPRGRLEQVAAILREHPEVKWDDATGQVETTWFHAASTRSIAHCQRRWPLFPYEVQVLRVGEAAIVAWGGEPFVEGQLDLKTSSPADLVQVAHMCSQYVGYLPTQEAAARGGHEANELCTYWAKLAPGSLEKVVACTRRMVAELFGDSCASNDSG